MVTWGSSSSGFWNLGYLGGVVKGAKFLVPGLVGLTLLVLTACGSTPPTAAPTATSVPAPIATTPPVNGGNGGSDGQTIFTGSGGCAACHTIEGLTVGAVGPDLTHIGTNAATRKPGLDARAYITESIRDPEVFVAEGVERATPGLMTRAITAGLSDADVGALVDFLVEQK